MIISRPLQPASAQTCPPQAQSLLAGRPANWKSATKSWRRPTSGRNKRQPISGAAGSGTCGPPASALKSGADFLLTEWFLIVCRLQVCAGPLLLLLLLLSCT